jgi:hypothetical protein
MPDDFTNTPDHRDNTADEKNIVSDIKMSLPVLRGEIAGSVAFGNCRELLPQEQRTIFLLHFSKAQRRSRILRHHL